MMAVATIPAMLAHTRKPHPRLSFLPDLGIGLTRNDTRNLIEDTRNALCRSTMRKIHTERLSEISVHCSVTSTRCEFRYSL